MTAKKRNKSVDADLIKKGLHAAGTNKSQIWRKLDALGNDDPRRISFRSFLRNLQHGEMNKDILMYISKETGIDPRYFMGEYIDPETGKLDLKNINDIPESMQDIYRHEHLVDEDGYLIPSYRDYEMDRTTDEEFKENHASLVKSQELLFQYLYIAGMVGVTNYEKTPIEIVHYSKDHITQNRGYYFEEIQKTMLRVYYSIQNRDEQYCRYIDSIVIPDHLKKKLSKNEEDQ